MPLQVGIAAGLRFQGGSMGLHSALPDIWYVPTLPAFDLQQSCHASAGPAHRGPAAHDDCCRAVYADGALRQCAVC